jgi:zinc transporter ZupT
MIIDGLAVGASFAESLSLGLSTTIAVVCHEVPHELGNYAVLIKCGFTHFQALFFNLLSATTCLFGFYIGVSISTDPQISLWIFSITAGMFIYVSLVDLVLIL